MNEDLINEVKALAGEVYANETKENQLRTQLAQICIDNYNQYIYPMLVQQKEILDAISNALHHDLKLYSFSKSVTIDDVGYDVCIRFPYTNSNKLKFRIEPSCNSSTIVECLEKPKEPVSYWYDNVTIISHFLGNEDTIQMTSEAINAIFVDQYNKIKRTCAEKNEKLKAILDELIERLNVAHVPTSKEDGTVEVMIGGKKFVGKLEEDTNGHTDN